MGHHIDAEGRFQSDRYPDLAPDKIVVSFKHPQAHRALAVLADDYEVADPGLAADIRARLGALSAMIERAGLRAIAESQKAQEPTP